MYISLAFVSWLYLIINTVKIHNTCILLNIVVCSIDVYFYELWHIKLFYKILTSLQDVLKEKYSDMHTEILANKMPEIINFIFLLQIK